MHYLKVLILKAKDAFKLVLCCAWQLVYCEIIFTEPVSKIIDKPECLQLLAKFDCLNFANYYETIEITVLQLFTFELLPFQY